jgi:hypothetical protein
VISTECSDHGSVALSFMDSTASSVAAASASVTVAQSVLTTAV